MILKSKIGYFYFISFFVLIPAILVAYYLIYTQVIALQFGMIIFVFSLPFLILPFVFEYYTLDNSYLRVKNILGLTTKKVAFADYEDIYALDKSHGKRGSLTSSSIYIVDKKERIIQLRSYYCANLDDFIAVLCKGKTLREDRAELHLIRNEIKGDCVYIFLMSVIILWIICSNLSMGMKDKSMWWFIGCIVFLLEYCLYLLLI
jgi:hypothetical protein